jgi:restriction endonuclease Mrr
MSIQATISGKGVRLDVVEKLIREALAAKYPEATIAVSKQTIPTSRPERFAAAVSDIENAKSELESLKDELQEWHDNLPENLQSGDKADQLDNAVNELDSMVSDLDNVVGTDVEFPGMF